MHLATTAFFVPQLADENSQVCFFLCWRHLLTDYGAQIATRHVFDVL